jgi:hypothetical protein
MGIFKKFIEHHTDATNKSRASRDLVDEDTVDALKTMKGIDETAEDFFVGGSSSEKIAFDPYCDSGLGKIDLEFFPTPALVMVAAVLERGEEVVHAFALHEEKRHTVFTNHDIAQFHVFGEDIHRFFLIIPKILNETMFTGIYHKIHGKKIY